MVKAQSSSQVHEAETDKCQNHEAHASNGEKNSVDGDNFGSDVFRWSRCKTPLPQKFMRSVGVPLPFEYLEVVLSDMWHIPKRFCFMLNVIVQIFIFRFLLGGGLGWVC